MLEKLESRRLLSSGSVTLSTIRGGKLDLANNTLIVSDASTLDLVDPTKYVGWNGSGIVTTQTSAIVSNLISTLAVATAYDVLDLSGSQTAFWAGQTVTATDTLVMYTYNGDANLSGYLDADDYFQIGEEPKVIDFTGTAQNDRISVGAYTDGHIVVSINGHETRTTSRELRIDAHAGNDRIVIDLGEVDADVLITIYGAAGDDTIFGGAGAERIFAGDGNDMVAGNNGRDTVYGDAGDDSVRGGGSSDLLDGGDGYDTIRGDAGNDNINGGDQPDRIRGSAGDDQLHGGGGRDLIAGEAGGDILWGDGGNDVLSGGDDSDLLDGGSGDDDLSGDDGPDHSMGGTGQDVNRPDPDIWIEQFYQDFPDHSLPGPFGEGGPNASYGLSTTGVRILD